MYTSTRIQISFKCTHFRKNLNNISHIFVRVASYWISFSLINRHRIVMNRVHSRLAERFFTHCSSMFVIPLVCHSLSIRWKYISKNVSFLNWWRGAHSRPFKLCALMVQLNSISYGYNTRYCMARCTSYFMIVREYPKYILYTYSYYYKSWPYIRNSRSLALKIPRLI